GGGGGRGGGGEGRPPEGGGGGERGRPADDERKDREREEQQLRVAVDAGKEVVRRNDRRQYPALEIKRRQGEKVVALPRTGGEHGLHRLVGIGGGENRARKIICGGAGQSVAPRKGGHSPPPAFPLQPGWFRGRRMPP